MARHYNYYNANHKFSLISKNKFAKVAFTEDSNTFTPIPVIFCTFIFTFILALELALATRLSLNDNLFKQFIKIYLEV